MNESERLTSGPQIKIMKSLVIPTRGDRHIRYSLPHLSLWCVCDHILDIDSSRGLLAKHSSHPGQGEPPGELGCVLANCGNAGAEICSGCIQSKRKLVLCTRPY